MKLNDLQPAPGAVRKSKRRGQGPGSGNGKTGGRGMNGQGSRRGSSVRSGFEGGQMPLYRRIPKRGFHNPFRKEFSVINLSTLQEVFASGATVTIEELTRLGYIRPSSAGIKVLGDGDLNKKLVIHAHRASAAARAKIELGGGKLELVAEVPATAENKRKPKGN